MWKNIVMYICLILIVLPDIVFADCEQFDFGAPNIQYYIYSNGRVWDFTANRDITVNNIETLSRLAGSGTYSLTIEILINDVQQALWIQNVNTTYTNYTHSKSTDFVLNNGDTVRYKISGGTQSNPGGAITGPNYVKLCNNNNATISGFVYQADGITPITGDEHINIDIYNHDNPHNPIMSTIVNSADGSYVINGLPAGEFELRTHADNYIDEFWAHPLSVYYRNLSKVITLGDNETRAGINFQLDEGSTISGTVYQTNGTTPLHNIAVCAYHDNSCGKMWDFCTISDDNGAYSIRVPDGNFYLDAGAGTSYIPEWWSEFSSVRDCEQADQITIVGGDIQGKNFQLEEGVTISGTIYHNDGVTPIIGDPTIGIGVVRSNPCDPQGATFSLPINDNDGTYELLVEPGTYFLQVWADNYIDEWWNSPKSVYSCNEAKQISVQLGAPVTGRDFQLESGAIITGTIYKSNGNSPLIEQEFLGIEVTTQNPCQYSTPNFLTQVDPSNATYSIHVPGGTYYVMANTGDWFSSEWWAAPYSVSTNFCGAAQSIIVEEGNTYPNINFQLGSNFSWNLFLPAIISGKR